MNHVPGEKLEEDRPKMLCYTNKCHPQLYTVRSVPCVALVGVEFLLRDGRECHSENMKKLVLSRREQILVGTSFFIFSETFF